MDNTQPLIFFNLFFFNFGMHHGDNNDDKNQICLAY